ncbi:MAG TPA: hypothetical protein VFZ16_17880 [Hyphomicrobiaceae bacterium]|nr:hypothetical protein [Hyphomicrobiaceae bacterium]
MANDIDQFRTKIADLGARIEASINELHKQGVLHGAEREKAADLKIEHARIAKAAASGHLTVAGAIRDELANDAELLRHAFARWVAKVDRRSEQ